MEPAYEELVPSDCVIDPRHESGKSPLRSFKILVQGATAVAQQSREICLPTSRLFRSAKAEPAYDVFLPSGCATDLSATVEVTYYFFEVISNACAKSYSGGAAKPRNLPHLEVIQKAFLQPKWYSGTSFWFMCFGYQKIMAQSDVPLLNYTHRMTRLYEEIATSPFGSSQCRYTTGNELDTSFLIT